MLWKIYQEYSKYDSTNNPSETKYEGRNSSLWGLKIFEKLKKYKVENLTLKTRWYIQN